MSDTNAADPVNAEGATSTPPDESKTTVLTPNQKGRKVRGRGKKVAPVVVKTGGGQKKATPTVKAALLKQVKAMDTKSAKIRALDKAGYSRGDIVRIFTSLLGVPIIYQHVRNVLVAPIKRS